MEKQKINPESFFNFEFSNGSISYSENEGNAIVIPLDSIIEFTKLKIEEEPYNIFYHLGSCIGNYFGKALALLYRSRGMEDDIFPEDFLNNLNSILSLHGMGILDMETWGDVLLLEWQTLFRSKLLTSGFHEGILAGTLRKFSQKEFDVATLENGMRTKCKFLAGNSRMVKFARQWVEEGAGTGEIVTRLRNGQHLLLGR